MPDTAGLTRGQSDQRALPWGLGLDLPDMGILTRNAPQSVPLEAFMRDTCPVTESCSHGNNDQTKMPDQHIRRTADVIDFYSMAAHSFQENLNWIEKEGRKDSPDWRLANGLLRLAEGLQQDYTEREERLKSFARSWRPPQ